MVDNLDSYWSFRSSQCTAFFVVHNIQRGVGSDVHTSETSSAQLNLGLNVLFCHCNYRRPNLSITNPIS